MVLRFVLDRRTGNVRDAKVSDIVVHPARTILIGMVGGLVVGMTSVGSGSLMIVMLLFLYPMIGANQLVGTDLAQALPLTGAAALGALAFGTVSFGITTSRYARSSVVKRGTEPGLNARSPSSTTLAQ